MLKFAAGCAEITSVSIQPCHLNLSSSLAREALREADAMNAAAAQSSTWKTTVLTEFWVLSSVLHEGGTHESVSPGFDHE